MFTHEKQNKMRVTLSLDPVDVDLLDRLAVLEGRSRSSEMQSILEQMRPMLRQTVEAFEAANRQRDAFNRAAAQAQIEGFEHLMPEVERLQNAYLGAMARLEGAAAAADPEPDDDAPASNTGATN